MDRTAKPLRQMNSRVCTLRCTAVLRPHAVLPGRAGSKEAAPPSWVGWAAVCLMSKMGRGAHCATDITEYIPGHGQKRIRDPPPSRSDAAHVAWAAESSFVVPLGPLKGPKPRPNQTHNVVSFAGGCTPSRRDQLPARKNHAPLPLAALPCRIGPWPQHCDACGFFGPRPALGSLPSGSVPNEAPGMTGGTAETSTRAAKPETRIDGHARPDPRGGADNRRLHGGRGWLRWEHGSCWLVGGRRKRWWRAKVPTVFFCAQRTVIVHALCILGNSLAAEEEQGKLEMETIQPHDANHHLFSALWNQCMEHGCRHSASHCSVFCFSF